MQTSFHKAHWVCHCFMSRPSEIPYPVKFKQAFKFNFLQQILEVLQLAQFNLCHEPCLPLLSLLHPSFKLTVLQIKSLHWFSFQVSLHANVSSSTIILLQNHFILKSNTTIYRQVQMLVLTVNNPQSSKNSYFSLISDSMKKNIVISTLFS
jgi:hypothetical protein